MYRRFRNTVEHIIVRYGKMTLDEFYEADSKLIKIEKKGFLDFVIEKNGNTLYVGYYRVENGDSISDPIFVFEIRDNLWHPIRCEQVLGTTDIGMFEHGRYYFYRGWFADVRTFATSCAKEWKEYYL